MVNLTRRLTHTYFPEEAYNGGGFCWAAAYPSPDCSLLAVDGCYWGAPYEVVLYEGGRKRYDELSKEEQEALDRNWSELDSRREVLRFTVPDGDLR